MLGCKALIAVRLILMLDCLIKLYGDFIRDDFIKDNSFTYLYSLNWYQFVQKKKSDIFTYILTCQSLLELTWLTSILCPKFEHNFN